MIQRLTEYGCGFTNPFQPSDLMTDQFSYLCTAGVGVYFLLVGAELSELQKVGKGHYILAFECRHYSSSQTQAGLDFTRIIS